MRVSQAETTQSHFHFLCVRIPPSEADIQAALASLAQKKGAGEAEAAPAEAEAAAS